MHAGRGDSDSRGRVRRTALAGAVLASTIGLAVGIGGFTFVYARGASYLTDEPAACANCHVMREHYAGWTAASHRAVAVCNDCHAPHDSVGKYATKAWNGFWHSVAFTTGRFPDPVRITGRNRRITEGACRSCHQDVVRAIDARPTPDRLACIPCHDSVGHLR